MAQPSSVSVVDIINHNNNKFGRSKSGKMMKNKPRNFPRSGDKKGNKIDMRMKKLFRKRARDYNSSDDDDEEHHEDKEQEQEEDDGVRATTPHHKDFESEANSEEDEEMGADGSEDEDEEEDGDNDEVQPGITQFAQGSRAFKMAFMKITNKTVPDDLLGPVLSGHKKLIAEKLAEDEAERKVKGEAKKEKHLVGEKGHVKPANFLDSHEKFLLGVATKGVVKLFNAVNKAQNAQKGLNPSRFKDAKVLGKRRKDAFFTELRKKPSLATDALSKGTKSTGSEGDNGPAWAPLRDSYMITSSKLKDWDKLPEKNSNDDMGDQMSRDSSSDED